METSPLEEASLKGFDSIVTLLLNHGALVNHVKQWFGDHGPVCGGPLSGKKKQYRQVAHRAGRESKFCAAVNRRSPYQAAAENGYVELAATINKMWGGATNLRKPTVTPAKLVYPSGAFSCLPIQRSVMDERRTQLAEAESAAGRLRLLDIAWNVSPDSDLRKKESRAQPHDRIKRGCDDLSSAAIRRGMYSIATTSCPTVTLRRWPG